MLWKRWIKLGLACAAMLALIPLSLAGAGDQVALAQQAAGPNLLSNPGMEGRYQQQCSLRTDPPWVPAPTPCDPNNYDYANRILWATAQVPVGWAAWWRVPNNNYDDPNYYNSFPHSCQSDTKKKVPADCRPWHNPEFRDTAGGPQEKTPSRKVAGENSQKYFTFYSVHEAGLYQIVANGIKAGDRLRFSVYMMAWSSQFNDPYHSDSQPTMGMQVGIDPYGGNNPWSANIVWSPVQESFDQFSLFLVEAVAQGPMVSVWTKSAPMYAIQHNDVYVDEASLVVVQPAPAGRRVTSSRPVTTTRVVTETRVTTRTIGTRLITSTMLVTRTVMITATTSSGAAVTTTRSITPTGTVTTTRPITPTTAVTATRPITPASAITGTQPVSTGVTPGPNTYTVVKGDTVTSIARRFGISWQKLVELNPIIKPPNYVIEIGWVLRVK